MAAGGPKTYISMYVDEQIILWDGIWSSFVRFLPSIYSVGNRFGFFTVNKTGTNLKSPLKRKDEETIDHGHKEKKEQIWRTKGGDQNNKGRKNES